MRRTVTPRARVLSLGSAWLVWIWLIALVAQRHTPWLTGPTSWPASLQTRVTPLARWDSGWYIGLAENGYGPPPTRVGEETNHAFFPLYPLLMRALHAATGLETSLAGNLVSALSLLGALVLFARWTRRHLGEERAGPALLLLLLFPPSFFFAAVYTESLLLFLSLAAVEAAESDRPGTAAAAGFLAGLTRISGVVLAPYLLLATLRSGRARAVPARRAWAAAASAGLAPLAGFGLFCLYFGMRFGDPLLFARAQHNWSKEPKTALEGPWLIAKTIVHDVTTGTVFHKSPARTAEGFFLALFLVVAAVLWRQSRRPEALYVAGTAGIVLLTGTLESGGRYVLPAFPAFAVMAALSERPRLFRALLALAVAAQAVYVWLFVHWLWVG